MIFGKLTLGATALHTHNDSHVLSTIVGVSTRRPFLASGLMTGGLVGLFGLSFADILTVGEIVGLSALSVGSIVLGLTLGQLTLVSSALRGSQLADSVMGSYGHLNRLRPRIIDAVERAKGGDV
jgi:hypothetical protein